MTWLDASARWYLVLIAVSWAFAPVIHWLCRALTDRGTTIVRPLAMLLAIYPGWLLSSLGVARFGADVVIVSMLCGAVLGWSFMVRQHAITRSWMASLVRVEAASFAAYVVYLWLRGFTPAILGTEKPMDVAFLASSARAVTMPPADPWFAGEPISYYYLGYLVHGTVDRLAQVPPEFGFNLALATIFSSTIIAAFGVARNAVRPWASPRLSTFSGVLAAFMVTLSGNLYAPWRLVQDASATIDAWWWDSAAGIGWRSSRIVCDGPRIGGLCQPPSTETINEFPFFSFLLGDLHPHLMALPVTLAVVALAWNLACRGEAFAAGGQSSWLVRAAISGALLGSLYAMNAWDFPTFLLVAAVAGWWGFRTSPRRTWIVVLIVAASIVAWLPFVVTYDSPMNASLSSTPGLLGTIPFLPSLLSSFDLYTGERTSIGEYLTIFGVPYLCGVALVLLGEAPYKGDHERVSTRVLLASAMVLVTGILFSAPIVPLCGIPLSFAIDQLLRARSTSPRTFALAAFSLAWSLSIAIEFVFVRDVFSDRMNTLFKFYFQAWTLYALGTAVTIALLWQATSRRSWQHMALTSAVAAGLLAGVAYPVVATHQWTEGFARWQGLDGLAYGEELDPGDVAAIRWLAAHAEPSDVVLEAAGCSYRPFGRLPFNRVSAFTGIPTVIGWGDNHQRQWRAGQPELVAQIQGRQVDVAAIYADPASPLIDKYDIRWLVVGSYESGDWEAECPTAGPYTGLNSAGYPGPGWEEAFRFGSTSVFEKRE